METNTFKKKSLGDFLDFWNGKSIKANQKGKYPVFGSNGIIGFSEKFLYENKIVLGRVGAYCGSVEYSKKKFWASDNTIVTATKDQNSSLVYTYYLLKHLNLNRWAGGAAQPLLTQNVIKQIITYIPSNSTQRRIAAILSAYDELIENNSCRIKILEEMARMIYQEWFVKFRFPGHEQAKFVESPLGMIPVGWEVVSFTSIADVLSGGTPKTTESNFWDGQIPFFTPKDATNNFYLLDTEKNITELGLSKCNSKLYPKDTVFITARGTVGELIMPGISMAMNQSCYALVSKNQISQIFLFLLVDSSVDYLKKNTGGATFETIVVDTFRRFNVIKPTETVIKDFTKTVQPIFDGMLNLLRRNNILIRTRDMMLPKLISGEIDVSDLDIPIEGR